jgi:hypothetical protein
LTLTRFHAHPLPRFNDVFLVGIVMTACLFTWEPALYLLVTALGASAWILPPEGSLRVEPFVERYRLVSFAILSVFLVFLITPVKSRQSRSGHDCPFGMTRVAAGAD